ncbi:MAG TPA: zf-HC2 domain-containing protein [Jiangellaceae bacterium]
MTACDEVRVLLGAHALGTLDPADEQLVRDHLESCDACSAELEDLGRTASALALVDLADVTGPAEAPDNLPDLLARARSFRRRRRLAALAVAASVAVLAGIGGLVAGGDGEPPVIDPPVASVSAEEAGVSLAVDAWDKGWGTALRAEVSGVPAGSRCSLVAVGQDGTREIAASWVVPGSGYEDNGSLTVDGAVGLRSGDVDHFAVVTVDGSTLVTVAATSSS